MVQGDFSGILMHISRQLESSGKLLAYQGELAVHINKPAHCEKRERKKLINKFLIIQQTQYYDIFGIFLKN